MNKHVQRSTSALAMTEWLLPMPQSPCLTRTLIERNGAHNTRYIKWSTRLYIHALEIPASAVKTRPLTFMVKVYERHVWLKRRRSRGSS
jgi:hypothetical protein